MIEENVSQTAAKFHYDGGFHITISAPGGEKIAKSTYNPRLGIVGGISILGTSGIVEPMSEAALIDTIKVEINSKFAGGADKLLITPGNYGRDFALNTFGLDLETGVKCSNYIGETLDYAVYKGFRQLLLIGHAGKLVKLAAGVMNTHSRVADCRSEVFATHAALAGAGAAQVKQLMESLTTEEMHRLLKSWGMSQVVWRSILAKMTARVNLRTGCRCQVEMVVFTIGDGILAQTENAAELAGEIRAMQAKV
jgi:cobalt-precorrin-5B (C1)-methyltransferase